MQGMNQCYSALILVYSNLLLRMPLQRMYLPTQRENLGSRLKSDSIGNIILLILQLYLGVQKRRRTKENRVAIILDVIGIQYPITERNIFCIGPLSCHNSFLMITIRQKCVVSLMVGLENMDIKISSTDICQVLIFQLLLKILMENLKIDVRKGYQCSNNE